MKALGWLVCVGILALGCSSTPQPSAAEPGGQSTPCSTGEECKAMWNAALEYLSSLHRSTRRTDDLIRTSCLRADPDPCFQVRRAFGPQGGSIDTRVFCPSNVGCLRLVEQRAGLLDAMAQVRSGVGSASEPSAAEPTPAPAPAPAPEKQP